jgi:hypothetical protein
LGAGVDDRIRSVLDQGFEQTSPDSRVVTLHFLVGRTFFDYGISPEKREQTLIF